MENKPRLSIGGMELHKKRGEGFHGICPCFEKLEWSSSRSSISHSWSKLYAQCEHALDVGAHGDAAFASLLLVLKHPQSGFALGISIGLGDHAGGDQAVAVLQQCVAQMARCDSLP
jgi:hypothetical protein